jgi:hypothetical protein
MGSKTPQKQIKNTKVRKKDLLQREWQNITGCLFLVFFFCFVAALSVSRSEWTKKTLKTFQQKSDVDLFNQKLLRPALSSPLICRRSKSKWAFGFYELNFY